MEQNKLISVLLPVRNGSKHIFQAIESILLQTYTNFELIVVNDGSSDNTEEIINSFLDPRIKTINTEGVGLVSALNLGLKHCEGEYIARMDADDISIPNRFETQVALLNENSSIGVVCSDIEVIDDIGNTLGFQKDIISNTNYLVQSLTFKKNMKPIIHPSVLIRKQLFELIGGYRAYDSAEDRDLWLRLIPHTTFFRISKPLVKYRITQTGISQTKYIEQKSNSMLAVLNYEIIKIIGVDLYIENPEILNHFRKTFFVYAEKGKKEFDSFISFKQRYLSGNTILKLINIFSLKANYRVVKYFLFNRHNDKKQIVTASAQIVSLFKNISNLKNN